MNVAYTIDEIEQHSTLDDVGVDFDSFSISFSGSKFRFSEINDGYERKTRI